MRLISSSILSVALALGIGLFASPASAESSFVTGATTPLTANARVDFRITVPRVLYLRVGTGTALANNATINLIDFTVPAANIGDGTSVAASAASGDLGNGAVTARLIGNDGDITLSSTTAGALSDGAGSNIGYSNISTASAVLVSPTALAAPALADGATTTTTVTATNRVVNRDARWTYSYNNTQVAPAGVYGGVNVNNGRVTYTATML